MKNIETVLNIITMGIIGIIMGAIFGWVMGIIGLEVWSWGFIGLILGGLFGILYMYYLAVKDFDKIFNSNDTIESIIILIGWTICGIFDGAFIGWTLGIICGIFIEISKKL